MTRGKPIGVALVVAAAALFAFGVPMRADDGITDRQQDRTQLHDPAHDRDRVHDGDVLSDQDRDRDRDRVSLDQLLDRDRDRLRDRDCVPTIAAGSSATDEPGTVAGVQTRARTQVRGPSEAVSTTRARLQTRSEERTRAETWAYAESQAEAPSQAATQTQERQGAGED